METVLIIIGFIVLCLIGIAWDYYKPARFRTGYHNVKTLGDSHVTDWSDDSWGSDCGGDGGGGD